MNWTRRHTFYAILATTALIAVAFVLTFSDGLDGSTHGLRQGMSKAEVIAALKEHGVTQIEPHLVRTLRVTARDSSDFNELIRSDGICLTDHAGSAANFTIGADDSVVMTYGTASIPPELSGARTRNELSVGLMKTLRSSSTLLAANCIPNSRWVSLIQSAPAEIEFLLQFSEWVYDAPEPGSYTSITLTFRDDSLEQLDRQWGG